MGPLLAEERAVQPAMVVEVEEQPVPEEGEVERGAEVEEPGVAEEVVDHGIFLVLEQSTVHPLRRTPLFAAVELAESMEALVAAVEFVVEVVGSVGVEVRPVELEDLWLMGFRYNGMDRTHHHLRAARPEPGAVQAEVEAQHVECQSRFDWALQEVAAEVRHEAQ